MDRLKALYQNLTRGEKNIFRQYLIHFHVKGPNKTLLLFELIESNPKVTQEEASRELYGNPKSKAFIMMKSRLYEKLTEFMPLTINAYGQSQLEGSDYNMDIIEIRKNMLIASVLKARRLANLAEEFLEKSVKLARRCSIPELEIDALLRLRLLKSGKNNDFHSITKEIGRAIAQMERDIDSLGIYHIFFRQHNLRTGHDEEKISFLEEHIPELELKLKIHYSVRADYYLQMLKQTYFLIVGDYEEGKSTILYLVDLVSNNPGLKSPSRLSAPWFQLGFMEMKFDKYAEAIEAFTQALSLSKKGTNGYVMISLMITYSHIYQEDLESASKIIKELKQVKSRRYFSPRYRGLHSYLKACVEYKQGDLNKAYLSLQENTEMGFDKEGWVTGIRIFEIMILIDKSEFDLASLRLENLRKHLSRYSSDLRSVQIFRIMTKLERKGFRFEDGKGIKKMVKQLEKTHPWTNLGHEVIRFENWIKARLGSKSDS